jgi:hypothetical protein
MIPLNQRIQQSIPTGATTDIYIQRIKPGWCARITHVALSDDAAGDITVIFGVTDIVGFRPLIDKQLVTTGDTAWNLVNFTVGEEDLLTCRVTTNAGSGQVTFSVSGELYPREDYAVIAIGAAVPAQGGAA